VDLISDLQEGEKDRGAVPLPFPPSLSPAKNIKKKRYPYFQHQFVCFRLNPQKVG